MEGLLFSLIFAGLCFVMMRFMHGGHGSHGDDKQNKNQQKRTEPVCGMEVDVESGYGKMHDGNLYRFCSRDYTLVAANEGWHNPKSEEPK